MTVKIFLVATFIALTLALETDNIPQVDVIKNIQDSSDNAQKRIIGGKLARPKQFPYQVGFVAHIVKGIIQSWCGGSIISSRWILTAAHCVYIEKPYQLANGSYAFNKYVNELVPEIDVYVGLTNTADPNEQGRQIFHLKRENIIKHETYHPVILHDDIALLHLPTDIQFNDYVKIISLPRRSQNQDTLLGHSIVTSGWGIFTGSQISTHLRYTEMSITSNYLCSPLFGNIVNFKKQICVNARGKSGCRGDSGGPAVLTEDNNRLTLVGITSFVSSLGCEKGYPTVFTRVHNYLDWIHEKTGIPIED